MTTLLLVPLFSFVAQVNIDVERIDDDTVSMKIGGEGPISMAISETPVPPDELMSARNDQTGDGKFDLMDVRAIQILNGDPAKTWKPRREMRIMAIECPVIYFADNITFERRGLLTAAVLDISGHALRIYQKPHRIIQAECPADLEVTIKVDVATAEVRIRPTEDGVEYSIIGGQ